MGFIEDFMGATETIGLRQRIAILLDRAITRGSKPEGRRFSRVQVRAFVKSDLNISVNPDENGHYKYGQYSDDSAHAALEKILDGEPAFQTGKQHRSAKFFELALLNYLNMHADLADIEIPDNIFRQSFRDDQKLPFASKKYLRNDGDHAEYLCRRFLDECSRSPKRDMGLMDEDYSGLIALIVLETFHADGQTYRSITFSDTFDCRFDSVGEISMEDKKYTFRRISPANKPTISKTSVGRTIRDRYTAHSRKHVRHAENLDVFQQRVINDLIVMSVGKIFPKILDISQNLEDDFNSGSLFRTVLDVEKGAVFTYQVAHGRFWIFAFCPVEQKVYEADGILREKIVEHYENAISG